MWKTAGFLATSSLSRWMETIDYKAAFYDPLVDSALGGNRHFIILIWHEHILSPLFLRHHNNVTTLLSRHTDAEIVQWIAGNLGAHCVRGSTFQGGSAAVKQFLEMQRQGVLVFTPDGPRGPRRRMANGPIYLASKLQIPIVLLGIGYDKPWRIRSWDRFAIPKPFSRGRWIVSPNFDVPENLTKDGLEHFRQKFETLLTQFTDLAETWAESGTPYLNESVLCSGPKCSITYHGINKPAVIR